MKKFIPTILLLCLFTNSCNLLRRTKEAVASSFAPYYLVQDYSITASRHKTYVKASVYYSQLIENSKPKFVSKIEFNGIEMNKGLFKIEPNYSPPCGIPEQEKKLNQLDNPTLTITPIAVNTPEPTPKESDFFVVLDEYKTENIITVASRQNKIETYKIDVNPIAFANPDTIKLSRSKDNVIQLLGKGSDKKENLNYFIRQDEGESLDEEETIYNPTTNTIQIPANSVKKLKKGKASFYLTSFIIGTVSKLSGQMYSVSFSDDICVEIVN
jgi:hypothetical protein